MTKVLKGTFEKVVEITDICLCILTKANLLGRVANVYVKLVADRSLPSLIKIGADVPISVGENLF
jgi:delta-aminolevulinic acid dehydratase/porphobilinogen synthase